MPDPLPEDNETEQDSLVEERYSLRELMRAVAAEQRSGAFSMEHLRQSDISRMFEVQSRSNRAHKSD